MKIYVASSLQNWKLVREIYSVLTSNGHTITFDWTPLGESMFGDGSDCPKYTFDSIHLQGAAMKEVAGVRSADVFLLAYSGGCGTYFEFGCAYEAGKHIVILGRQDRPDVKPVSFNHLPHVNVFNDIDGVVAYLERIHAPSLCQVRTGCDDSC